MSFESDVVAALKAQIEQLTFENAQLQQGLANMHAANAAAKNPAGIHLDCHGYITIKHFANGGLQTSGNIGDLEYALGLLDHAKDAIRAQHASMMRSAPLLGPDGNPIVNLQNRDVDLKQREDLPTRALGDMTPEERGTDLLQ